MGDLWLETVTCQFVTIKSMKRKALRGEDGNTPHPPHGVAAIEVHLQVLKYIAKDVFGIRAVRCPFVVLLVRTTTRWAGARRTGFGRGRTRSGSEETSKLLKEVGRGALLCVRVGGGLECRRRA